MKQVELHGASEIPSRHAISLLRAPAAAQWAISRSRADSAFKLKETGAPLASLIAAVSSAIHASPAETSRTQEMSIDIG